MNVPRASSRLLGAAMPVVVHNVLLQCIKFSYQIEAIDFVGKVGCWDISKKTFNKIL